MVDGGGATAYEGGREAEFVGPLPSARVPTTRTQLAL